MVSIRRRILHKGELIKEQFIRTLQDHEDRLAAVEGGEGSATAYDDTEVKADISALETAIGDTSSGLTKSVNDNTDAISDLETAIGSEEIAGSILARIKALEDAE